MLRGDAKVHKFLEPDRGDHAPLFIHEAIERAIAPHIAIDQDWADVLSAFTKLNDNLWDVALFNFFMPWLHQFVPDEDQLDTNRKSKDRDNPLAVKQYDILRRRVKPKSIPPMPRDLLALCRKGEQLLTQYKMMQEAPTSESKTTHPDYGMARVGFSMRNAQASSYVWSDVLQVWRSRAK